MTDSDFCAEDFDRLLSTLCDSGLEPQQLACLNRLLRSDADLRRRYLLYMGVHATLHYVIGVPTGGGADSDCRDSRGTAEPGETLGTGLVASVGAERRRGDSMHSAWQSQRRCFSPQS